MTQEEAKQGKQGPERTAFDDACRYLSARERCAAQVRTYLKRRGFPPEEVDDALRLLQQKRIIDDTRYARLYVEVRSRRSPRSGSWLMRELRIKGVDEETASRAVAEFFAETPEEDLAARLLDKMPRQDGPDFRERAARKLASRGFRASLALRRTNQARQTDESGTGEADEAEQAQADDRLREDFDE